MFYSRLCFVEIKDFCITDQLGLCVAVARYSGERLSRSGALRRHRKLSDGESVSKTAAQKKSKKRNHG